MKNQEIYDSIKRILEKNEVTEFNAIGILELIKSEILDGVKK